MKNIVFALAALCASTALGSAQTEKQKAIIYDIANAMILLEDCPALELHADTMGSIILANDMKPDAFAQSAEYGEAIKLAGIKAKAARATIPTSQRCLHVLSLYGPEGTTYAGLVVAKAPKIEAAARRWFEEQKRLQLRAAVATSKNDKASLLDVARETFRHGDALKASWGTKAEECRNLNLLLLHAILWAEPWDDAGQASNADACWAALTK